MTTNDLIPIREQLTRIEQKIEGQFTDKYIDIKQVSAFTSLSQSTIRRRIATGELKCTRGLGKLLFKKSVVDDWLNS